jgi:hypothetical protein
LLNPSRFPRGGSSGSTDKDKIMNKFTVTLADLRKAGACIEGYNRLVRALQSKEFTVADDGRNSYIRWAYKEPISIEYILNSNGLDDALWSLRCVEDANRDLRLFAVWCARQVEHLLTDPRSKEALEVAERHANGQATDDELVAAWDAARVAAADAAGVAARVAARVAAWDAAMAAAMAAAWDAAADAARTAQQEMLIKMCRGQAPWQNDQP